MNRKLQWNQLRWLLLAGGISILLVRDIYLATTGGGRLCATGQFFPWFLLFSELVMSAVATIGGFVRWMLWASFDQTFLSRKLLSGRVIVSTAAAAVILHFVRLALFSLTL